MAKHNGITIRVGAAYDRVEVRNGDNYVEYDRSAMRKDGKPQLQGELRRTTVEVWASQREDGKNRRNARRANAAKHDRKRSA